MHRDCQSCIKSDVCSLLQKFNEIHEGLQSISDPNFNVTVSCNKYSNKAFMNNARKGKGNLPCNIMPKPIPSSRPSFGKNRCHINSPTK